MLGNWAALGGIYPLRRSVSDFIGKDCTSHVSFETN